MKNFKSNLKQTIRAFPLLVVMLLCSSAVLAVPGWSNTYMTARQSTADELTDRQVSSAWQPTYQGYQSQIFEVGTTNVPSDYSEVSSGSSDEQGGHKGHLRKLGGGTDVGEQSELSPIGEPWIMLLFALLACGVIAYRKMNFRHNKNMKNTILNQLFSSCKKWKTLVLIGMLLTLGVGQMSADNTRVVGVAATNSANGAVIVKANIGDGNTWWNYTITSGKAGITFEGKKLYIGTMNEKYGGVDALKISVNGTDKQPYSGWTTSGTFQNDIFNYDATNAAKYADVSMTNGARVYFDASTWSQTAIKLVTGHANHQKYYTLSAVTNTKLYYGTNTDSWSDAMGFGIVGGTTRSGGNDQWLTDVSDKAKEYSGWKNYGLTATGTNQAYLVVPAGKAGEQPTVSYYSTAYSSLNSTQTIKFAISENGGTPAELASGVTPATISMSSYKFVSGTYNSVSAETPSAWSAGSSTYNKTLTAARTATTTLTVSNVTSGYTFLGWYSAASGGTQLSTNTTYTYYPTAATTVYARFSHETTHTVSITYKCGDVTVSTATSQAIGQVTASSITAPTVTGYTFSGWKLGTGISNQSASTSVNPISVKTKASGNYTMQANYTEDLTTTWYIAGATGTNYPFTGWGTSGIQMTKKTGHSTEEIYYCDVVVNRVATGNEYEFQTYNSANDTYYGYNNKDITKESNSTTVYSNNPNNMHFKPYLTGTYEFKLDKTGANPVLTVTWPVFNQLRFYSAQTGGTGTNTYDFNTASTPWTKTVSLTAGSTYWFKVIEDSEFFGNTGTMTRTNSSNWTMSNVTENCGITPDFTGDYTFSYNPSTNSLSVTYPLAYKLTYDIGTVKGGNGSITSSPTTSSGSYVLSGNSVTLTAPAAKTGYTWKGWYTNAAGTEGKVTDTNRAISVTMSADKTLYACYTEKDYTVTVSAGTGGSVPSGSVTGHVSTKVTLPTATADVGYYFTGWTVTTGTATLTSASSATAAQVSGLTAAATVTANFAPIWYLKGDFNSWGETLPLTLSSSTSGSVTLTTTTAKLSNSKFKIYNKQTDAYYQKANASITRASNTASSSWTSGGTSNDMKFNSDVIGDYVFTVTFSTTPTALTVTYPTAYTITYGMGTNAGSNAAITASSTPSFTSGDYVLKSTAVTFSKGTTKTGYTWKGWYSNAAGTGTLHSSTDGNWTSAANTRTANLSVYACYNKVNYTITYNLNGGTQQVSPAPATTYTVTDAVTLPTPTKSGYKFAGWYENEDLTTGGRKTNITAGTTGNKTYWAKWIELATFDVYFYNKDNWASPHAYIWNSVGNRHEHDWPGGTMTTHQGKVYKYEYESADDYNKVQFNDGTSSNQYDNLDLPAYNQAFYNPEGAGTWTEYIMVAAFPTETITAVIGEKVTIEPIVAWAEGINFSDITITSVRASGPSDINAVVAGTKLMVSGTANGTAKFTVTYNYSSTTITKTLNVKIVDGITIQAKIAKNDSHWTYTNIVKMHYWGTGVADSDLTMTWMKADDTYNYYQASVPKGTDGRANFIFFYDYMENTDANRWRQTADITNVTSSRCYTISYAGNTNTKSNQSSVDGICSDSWQVQIVMGSGDIYTSNIVENSDDIVSFFAPSNANESYSYRQGTVTIEHNGATVATLPANTFNASGVYTAKIKTTSPYGLTNLALYEGNYYIRTDGADGGWDNYKTNPDNLMTEFTRNTNFPNETFSYYWVKNVAKKKTENIKATVANDYNPVLCNFTADETANATDGVNLRFGYEPTTNDIVRGIIGGATTNNFLNIICADGSQVYKEMACTTLLDETLYASSPGDSKFQDKSNWVYEVIVYAKIDASHPVANVVLKSYYNGINYLLGMVKDSYGRETSTPVSFPVIKTGTTPGVYGLRVVYDFKTNRLFAAWAPADRVIDGVLEVDADVMFLRHEDGDAAQISFKTTSAEIVDIKQAIFALELDNEKGSNIERHYFISLPFDCKVSNIFGIGGFMTYWGIQRYRGDLRAEKGWFQETPTFWEWLSADDVMQAGEGYLLSVDKKALQNDGVWKDGIVYQKQETIIDPATHKPYKAVDGTDSVAWVTYTDGSLLTMYFPSTTSGFTITPATGEALTLTYPDQPCSITRDDRDKKDSNWKCIGTPGYKNVTITRYNQESEDLVYNGNKAPNFLYEFHEQTSGATWAKGTYTVTDGSEFTYHSFHSYMVQFAGTIDWAQYSKGDVAPSPIAPKRMPTADTKTTKVEIELLSSDNDALDRTFVWLQENATIGFDQNFDLNKMIEKKANQIYSLAENEVPFAANVLPLGTDTVPLVVNIANEGEYTFSLNVDKHVGMAPILYDMYKSEQINLLTTNYAVELEKGKHEDRFFLLFQPEAPIVTNFETTADGGQNVHSSEAIYDVLGRRVNTIYPGHLYIVNGEKRIAK